MALGTAHLLASHLAPMIPEVWSDRMNDFYRANLKAGAFFTDLSAEIQAEGDILHIPNLTQMSANTKTNGSEVTLNTATETSIDLTVSTWNETSFLIEDREAQQVKKSYGLQERYMKNAAYTVAATLEQALIDLFIAFSQTTGTSAAAIVDSNIRAAIQALDVADVPQEDRAWFLHPKQIWSEIQTLDRFSLLVNTAGADPVLKGHVGWLYGIPVIQSTKVDVNTADGTRKGALAHKDALVHASTLMRTQANYIPEYLGTLVTADILFGTVENRDTSGVWLETAS